MLVAQSLVKSLLPEDVARIWVFPPFRREDREWGTAVVARRADDERLNVLTVRYMLMTRGKRKGQGKVEVEDVGDSPPDVVHDVVQGVQDRAGETDPPVEIAPELWFGAESDEPPTEG